MKHKLVLALFFFVVSSASCQAEIFDLSFENKSIVQYASETKTELYELFDLICLKANELIQKKNRSDEAVKRLGEQMDLTLMWQTLQMVKSLHINRDKLDYRQLVVGATNGMLQAVDRWSRLEASEESKQFMALSQGSLSGIGARLKKKGRYVSIESVIKNSPAETVGLKRGDVLEGVDGKDVRNLKIEDVVSLVRGDSGTKVVLKIYRKDNNPKEFYVELTRASITVDTVSVEFKKIENKKIAILKIKEFDSGTKKQFIDAADMIENEKVDGIVLDIRNNPGGLVNEVNDICAVMCGRGKTVMSMQFPSGAIYHTNSDEILNPAWPKARAFDGIPIVCLVNRYSASAAEIMSACLKENLGVKLIGEKTFGKGVGQNVQNTPDGILFMTTFKWLTPSGRSIDGEGVEPDYFVEQEQDEEGRNLANTDLQMDKGLEVIDKMIEVKDFQNRFYR